MFGSLVAFCVSFIWTSGIFLCLIILDKLYNFKCFPLTWECNWAVAGLPKSKVQLQKKKKIKNPNLNRKPSAVYSLQFNVWPHSPESLSFGSLVLNMLPKTTEAFFPPLLNICFILSTLTLRLLSNCCFPGVLHMYVNEPANFKSNFYIITFGWLSLCVLCVSLFSCPGAQDWSMQQEELTSILFMSLLQVTSHDMSASFWSHLGLVQFFPLEDPHYLELAQLLTKPWKFRFPWYSSQRVSGTLM